MSVHIGTYLAELKKLFLVPSSHERAYEGKENNFMSKNHTGDMDNVVLDGNLTPFSIVYSNHTSHLVANAETSAAMAPESAIDVTHLKCYEP